MNSLHVKQLMLFTSGSTRHLTIGRLQVALPGSPPYWNGNLITSAPRGSTGKTGVRITESLDQGSVQNESNEWA